MSILPICLDTFRRSGLIAEYIPLLNNDMRDNEANTLHTQEQFIESTKLKPTRKRMERKRCGGLAYYPRLDRWRASNVELDPTMMRAWSYSWWQMLYTVSGTLLFNEYRYSNSTAKHQSKVRRWLLENGIEYTSIESPRGLQDLDSSVAYYKDEIQALKKQIAKPRSHKAKNNERLEQIQQLEKSLALAKLLAKKQAKARVS